MRYKTLIAERLESSLNQIQRVIDGISTASISADEAKNLLTAIQKKLQYVNEVVELEPEG